MSRRHGLTILEVLAATALLAILAATCVPLLQRVMRLTHRSPNVVGFTELSQLADAFVEDPARFGIDAVLQQVAFELTWPEQPKRIVASAQLHTSPDSDHAWLLFAADDMTVCRCIMLDEQEESP